MTQHPQHETRTVTGLQLAGAQARATAARVIDQVLRHGRLLDAALEPALAHAREDVPAALVQEMAYGALRWATQLQAITARLLKRPLPPKDQDVHALLLVGLYQLIYMRVPNHAAVSETVASAQCLGKAWSKGLLNASLRTFLRERDVLLKEIRQDPGVATSHPQWLLDEIRDAWPHRWRAILDANNQRGPMTLRVNLHRNTRADYVARVHKHGLAAAIIEETDCGVVLEEPVPVTKLPGFSEGCVSVQDAAAQLATVLLDVQPGQHVLDACAAPGGKLCHILEHCRGLGHVVALDKEPARLPMIQDNLARLRLTADVTLGNAANPADWWNGERFDRILLDAPCSSSGVIRRHPDIKVHRTLADVRKLVSTQARILESLWPLLTSGGKLLYVTCSIFPNENENQVDDFIVRHGDTDVVGLSLAWGVPRRVGIQILPGERDMDGFYYACLQKA
ncbi:MAG: 16S rRNA (cytosine(967)-C(5))-methyltransferase RsmB [Acidiferrobacterales bacterium]